MRDLGEWEALAERKIREAQEEGVFDNLPGSGLPISLEDDPFEPPDLRMAHRLLKNNGFAPAWIEEGKSIEAATRMLREKLSREWQRRREPAPERRGQLRATFEQEIGELNRRILAYNLTTPSWSVQKMMLDAERELDRAAR